MRKLTHLSLFSGIGGLDLAAEWAGFTTVGQCEWADFPTKVLEKHWPDVPRWRDIRTLTGEIFYERTGLRTVDIISGGFPCQPFSVAGKRRGKEDDRYLWPEMVRIIKELRPTWVVGENVAGIVRMALPDILSELEACGYRTRAFLIPACAVGARHRRYRVAIVAYSGHDVLPGWGHEEERGERQACHEPEPCGGSEAGDSCHVADTERKRERGLPIQPRRPRKENADIERRGETVPNADGTGCEEQYTSGQPDKTGFSGRGCNAGDVCHTEGQGLSDGAGQPLGAESEPERPDSNVPDTNRIADLRRHSCERTPGENGGGREHIRDRKEEYAEWQRRPAQSELGGVAYEPPGGVDGDLDFIINHYWDEEPDIPRIATGVKNRVDRLKALGNMVVPQQFYPAFRAIREIMEGTT